ncbi:acyl-CoA dehydrogenase family protein [Actinomycetospora endophytica]|uniref:Acyl-CoA dehydrogenase family protein n=1 Tax=Actinomycetospora endophytica TaxID=2291215 RepID=A0ABS8PCX8_9PSEU|nr:acyl-CoA dehydrogenase family protein [Actinomycetospora endophytica]MCD2195320.1 acyl-CoA dehydrogenase family protein [Actinomycetospora endophytica]
MTRMTYAAVHEPHTDLAGLERPDETTLREQVRAFAWDRLERRRGEIDEKRLSRELIPLLAEQGYLATLVAPDKGGSGLGLGASVAIARELGGVVPSLAALRAICGNFVAKPIEEFGTTEQIDTWLRPLVRGEITTSLAITEPASGSDVAHMTTTATRDGDGWVLHGAKKHASGAAEADIVLIYAATEPEAAASRRLTAFLVPTDRPGVSISPDTYLGLRGLSHAEIELDGVRLDDAHRLGEVGEGLRILYFGLAAERIDIAARATGCASRAFEEARAFSADRGLPGRPIRAHQGVSHRIADMRTTIDAGWLLTLRAARLYDRVLAEQGPEEANRVCDEESSIAKLFCARESFAVCDSAMQVMGGLGYEYGTAVEGMFRDSRVFRFGGGTDEIQQHIIQREEYRRFRTSREG